MGATAEHETPPQPEEVPGRVLSPAELADQDQAKLERSLEALRTGEQYNAPAPAVQQGARKKRR